jgi:hypothetical protein
VPETTLRRRLNGSKSCAETCAKGHKLNQFEEEVLEKKLLEADKRGFSIRPEFLNGLAQIRYSRDLQDAQALNQYHRNDRFNGTTRERRTRQSQGQASQYKPYHFPGLPRALCVDSEQNITNRLGVLRIL